MDLKIISAGAGSGKTYRLTTEMVGLLAVGKVRASGIIATTFTKKAAAELQERVRVRLLEEGLAAEANDLANALIGTVNGLGVKLLKRFAFEAGVSPETDIISDEDQQAMFNRSLATVLSNERVARMEELASRLGLNKSEMFGTDWRRSLKDLTEVARTNNLSPAVLEKSKQLSWAAFEVFLDKKSDRPDEEWNRLLDEHLEDAIVRLENNEDATKTTSTAVQALREIKSEMALRGELFWHQWVKISKVNVGAKSRDDFAPLAEFANSHLGHAGLHDDLKSFIFNVFDIATEAIDEFDRFKKSRGLLDYTDMEVLVNRLLDDPAVQGVLADELDLLMVDEFQDTSPIQLEIFLKLSRFAKHSIWVGDPKQSIYGFRGAEPALMNAIILSQGGLKKENILAHSWRSREDVVNATNAIFTKAFAAMPPEQVALQPKRCKKATSNSQNKADEPPEIQGALVHWHFRHDPETRPTKGWLTHCVANEVAKMLARGLTILPKGEASYRPARPSDVAILCRSNRDCQDIAEALHRAGLRAAISRAGLLATAESRLILACLKFILNRYDSLSIAEILRLGDRLDVEKIIENRLSFLALDSEGRTHRWGDEFHFIQQLNQLRGQVVELSSAEVLTLLLDTLDLRRTIAAWGNVEQRLANVDELIRLSLKYEEACNRLHTAASLGGFLLWLNDLGNEGHDMQGAGDNPLAINVLTYHKSKGLEFPVVICHSLEATLRDDVWGIALQSERTELDLNDLLGGRWVRFWVNPYADLFKNTLLDTRLGESEARLSKRRQALDEEARLLYVGITRARDYLVFPTYQRPATWLNRVCGSGDESRPALDPNSHLSPWEWAGDFLEIKTEAVAYPPDFSHAEIEMGDLMALPPANGNAAHLPYFLDTSHGANDLETVGEWNCSSPFNLPEVPERQQVAKAARAYFMAVGALDTAEEKIETAGSLLQRFKVDDLLETEELVKAQSSFSAWVSAKFPSAERVGQYPLRQYFGGQFFETNIDLLVKTEKGCALVFHAIFVGNHKTRKKRLKEMSGHLAACRSTAVGVLGKMDVGLFVHFVLEGLVVELK